MASGTNTAPPDPAESRQKRAGDAIRERSRQRLVLGAAEVFAERGYAGTTVNAIAERAGVSLGTLYTAWGSKRRLLRAYVEYTMTGSSTGVTEGSWLPQLQRRLDAASVSDPAARMRRVASIFRDISDRMGLPWRLLRDGAAVDQGVAQDRLELEDLRRETMAGLLDGIDEQRLRPGLNLDGAIDTMLVIASPGAFETLVESRRYSMDEFERWVGDTLIAALLADPDAQFRGSNFG
jgi:AcrR family transcriptional regulator